MIRNECIRDRLLKLLFTTPKPLDPKEFFQEQYAIFPGEVAFREFLLTDDHQIRTTLSKKILLRLVYHHCFPVPSKLLFNLLELQERDIPIVTDGDYIPQDHFIHLVNLYLLGIYLFSYHKGMHDSCIRDLNRLRRIAKQKSDKNNNDISLYRLFAILWSYFVLYHDIAYPLERIIPSYRDGSKDLFEVFQELEKYIREDISLISLSKIIAIKSVISDINISKFHDLYTKYHKIFKVTEKGRKLVRFVRDEGTDEPGKDDEYLIYNQRLKKWDEAIYLPSIDGVRSLKMMMSFFPPNSIGAVLERIDIGQPLAFTTYGEKEVYIFDDVDSRNPVSSNKYLWESAFENLKQKNRNYTWNYFLLKPNEFFDEITPSLFGFTIDQLKHLLKNFDEDDDFQKLKRLEVDSADDLGFYCYYKLFKNLYYREFDKNSSSLEKELLIIKKGNEKLSFKIPDITGKKILKWLSSEHKESLLNTKNESNPDTTKYFLPNRILDKGVNSLSTYVMNYICSNKVKIKKELIKDYNENIFNPLELYQSSEQCMEYIRDNNLNVELNLSTNDNIFSPFGELDFNEEFDLSGVIEGDEEHLENINEYLKLHLGEFKAEKLINDYEPSWTQIESNGFSEGGFVDHGFAAAVVLVSSNSINKEITKTIALFDTKQNMSADNRIKIFGDDDKTIPPFIRHLWLNYGLTCDKDISLLNLQLELLNTEVVSAIFLHNFYPTDAPSEVRSYRTNRNNQPFPYLAFLCDGIQRWDRKKFANQTRIDITDVTPGSLYNVIIKNNIIELHVPITSLDEDSDDKEIAINLEKYLRGIKSFIEIKPIYK